MNDTHQRDNSEVSAPSPAESNDPAEALAALDPADAPDLAEELADRLAEDLEAPMDGPPGAE